MKTSRVLHLLCALTLCSLLPAAADAQTCGSSPAANGTGYEPPTNTESLPTEIPRPGPEILYRPLRGASQLENAGIWHAAPTMVSGTTVYRDGEFLYQDWIYDDRPLGSGPRVVAGTNMPEPRKTGYPEGEQYAGQNAADIVEVRLKPTESDLALRITYNSMVDPEVVAATIALGGSSESHPMPHNAGINAPGQVFVTVHGCSGDIVNAADGQPLQAAPVVSTDLARRQVDVRIPYEAFDPRDKSAVRVALAAGLWDPQAGEYLRPDPAKPAFFNVAFREYGPWEILRRGPYTWADKSQNDALAAGDLSPLSATVDFVKLAGRVTDDSGIPTSGPMNRILVSHFEPTQGRGSDSSDPDLENPGGGCSSTSCVSACSLPDCTPTYSGRLQPYLVYVPDAPPPPGGYGLVLQLHGSSVNYNGYGPPATGTNIPTDPDEPLKMFTTTGRPSIFIQPGARGVNGLFQGLFAAGEFEAWADVAGRYKLHPGHVFLTGGSMGGYGVYKVGQTWPDLFKAIQPVVPAVGTTASKNTAFMPAMLGPPDPIFLDLMASLRNTPVIQQAGFQDPLAIYSTTKIMATTLQGLGYRSDAWFFNGTHEDYSWWLKDEYEKLFSGPPIDRDPRRVTYVVNSGWDDVPELGLDHDHAYWVSGLKRRESSIQTGKIDVVSHGFGTGDPPAALNPTTGESLRAGSPAYVRETVTWGEAPAASKEDRLTIVATNISEVTINAARAGVSCDAQVDITSDGPLKVTLGGPTCDE